MKMDNIPFLYFVGLKNLLKASCQAAAFLWSLVLLKKNEVTVNLFLAIIKSSITYLVKYYTYNKYLHICYVFSIYVK